MKKITYMLLVLALLSISGCSHTSDTEKYINDNEINATIVITSLRTGEEHIINKTRSQERFLPASTFKIPNSLIALQQGIVDEDDTISWDGRDKGFSEWNKDHSLKTAFSVSCVWFYQELAKMIGIESYLEYLEMMNYGNKMVGNNVDTFWLEGDIRISAAEQVEFLKTVYFEEFDFDEANYSILKELMIEEKTDNYTLRAKTGLAQRVTPRTGWYVGYVETDVDVWFFACNLEVQQESDADLRKDLAMMYLRELQIIE